MRPVVRRRPIFQNLAAVCAAAVLSALCAPVAAQADEASFESTEVTLRMVASQPEADGTIRAALLVDLAPGWKTYWRDPGEAGIPPRLDLSGSTNAIPVATGFPAPHRFGDEYGMSNGYVEPMAFAITMHRIDSDAPTTLRASVALGVCETICIPIAAELDVRTGLATPVDEALVNAAFAALPRPATARDGIVSATLSADGKLLSLVGEMDRTASVEVADVFVAGPGGWSFGKPSRIERDGEMLRVGVPVLGKPRKDDGRPLAVDAVVVTGKTSVETTGLSVARR